MKFLSIWKPDPAVWATDPAPEHMVAMGELVGELTRAGKLLDTGGVREGGASFRAERTSGNVVVTDGPFTETHGRVGGFAIFNVDSKDEAIALTSRFLEIAGDGTSELHEVSEFS